MTTPKVSVIIPVYNQANFLDAAIQSVVAQTYHDYEIIVVNDGSTDRTDEVAKQYQEKIRYINQENQGLAGARNTGINASKGEYVALLDSDDLWDSSFLRLMMDWVDKVPDATVYYCGIRYIDEAGKELPQRGGLSVNPEMDLFQQVLRSNFIIPSTVIMKKKAIMDMGLFDIHFRRLQDLELWIRLLKKNHKFAALENQYLVRYRIHGKNLSVDSFGGQLAAKEVIEKHFGLDDGECENWSDQKRLAYGGLYRYMLLTNIQRLGDWDHAELLHKAILSDPGICSDIDFFYELALGRQPLGLRGSKQELELTKNAAEIENLLLNVLHSKPVEKLIGWTNMIHGTAYKAIGLAAYNTDQFQLCRKYLITAIKHQPALLFKEKWVLGNILKSFLGKSRKVFHTMLHRRKALGQ
jgi:glycosyltransferase involved in cell wall biosynthesis